MYWTAIGLTSIENTLVLLTVLAITMLKQPTPENMLTTVSPPLTRLAIRNLSCESRGKNNIFQHQPQTRNPILDTG